MIVLNFPPQNKASTKRVALLLRLETVSMIKPRLVKIRDDIPHARLSRVNNCSIIQQNVNESHFYGPVEVNCDCAALCMMPERILEHTSEYSGNYIEIS